jgi:hypothetical protein
MTTAGSADTSNDVVDVNVDTADVVNGTTTEPLDVPPPPLDLEQGRGVQDTTDTTAVDASKPHCDTATTEDISMIQESPIYDYVTEDDDDAAGFLQLRSPNGICHERLPVPNLCAICLGHYQVGDAVVWSRLQCPHVFHQECILDWFINVNATGHTRGTPCPCCRQEFTDLEAVRLARKITWEPDRTMNLQHIGL